MRTISFLITKGVYGKVLMFPNEIKTSGYQCLRACSWKSASTNTLATAALILVYVKILKQPTVLQSTNIKLYCLLSSHPLARKH